MVMQICMSSQKDPGLLGSFLVTVDALKHLSNERTISLLVQGSDQQSQRLIGKQLEKPDFSIVSEPYSYQPRGCLWTAPANQVNCLFFKKIFYLFIFRQREGREKERERNINVWLPLMRPLLGD